MFQCTHGTEDPERAILPFIAANVAATAGKQAIVVCTVEAVWLGTTGGAERVTKAGFPPLTQVFSELVANGGQVWLCGACTKPRGITEDQLASGASIVGAARIVEEIAGGATPVSFA
jgi:predicted peroxiredoxin